MVSDRELQMVSSEVDGDALRRAGHCDMAGRPMPLKRTGGKLRWNVVGVKLQSVLLCLCHTDVSRYYRFRCPSSPSSSTHCAAPQDALAAGCQMIHYACVSASANGSSFAVWYNRSPCSCSQCGQRCRSLYEHRWYLVSH